MVVSLDLTPQLEVADVVRQAGAYGPSRHRMRLDAVPGERYAVLAQEYLLDLLGTGLWPGKLDVLPERLLYQGTVWHIPALAALASLDDEMAFFQIDIRDLQVDQLADPETAIELQQYDGGVSLA